MAESLSEQIIRRIDQAVELYHRLVLVVAPAGAGKTAALQDVAKAQHTGFRYINVNLELSRRLLNLNERQRSLQVPRLLGEIVRT